MSDREPPHNTNDFLLGEINATVKGTAEDVKALRIEMGGLAQEVAQVKHRVTTIEADRAAREPEHIIFISQMKSHIQSDTAWKSAHDAEKATERRHLYAIGTIIGLITAIASAVFRIFIA